MAQVYPGAVKDTFFDFGNRQSIVEISANITAPIFLGSTLGLNHGYIKDEIDAVAADARGIILTKEGSCVLTFTGLFPAFPSGSRGIRGDVVYEELLSDGTYQEFTSIRASGNLSTNSIFALTHFNWKGGVSRAVNNQIFYFPYGFRISYQADLALADDILFFAYMGFSK